MTRNTSFKKSIWLKVILSCSILLFLLLLIFVARNILLPFFLAFLLAYVLDPVVDILEKRGIRRTVGIAVVTGVMLILFLLVCSYAYPILHRHISELADTLPVYAEKIKNKLGPVISDFSVKYELEIDQVVDNAKTYLKNNASAILAPLSGFTRKAFSSTVNLLLSLLNIVIIPVFAFYLLKDMNTLMPRLARLVPVKYRDWTIARFREVDQAMGRFIRGQLTVAAILAIYYSVFLWITGIPTGIVIGIVAGFANIVPYLGIAVGVIPACVFAYLEFGFGWQIIAVLAIFISAQMLEGMVITPKIVGDSVGLHPLAVMIALLIGGELFGFLGILLAVPGAAAIMVFVKSGYDFYINSELYLEKQRVPKKKKYYRHRPKTDNRNAKPSSE